jgi:hypothetical protein
MIALVANFFNLVGPDFLVIAIILFVLFGIPALIAVPFFSFTRQHFAADNSKASAASPAAD